MKRLLVVLLGCVALFAAAPGQAQARECGLPNKTPLWIDFADGSVPYWPMFARPGVIAAAANFIFPPQIRAMGAKTIYWEMNFRQRVGTPTNPLDPEDVERLGRPDLLPRGRLLGLRDAVDRAQRDVGLEPADAVVADERAVPAERDHLRQAPARARRASVPAPVHEALHRRRGSRLVARGLALHGLRARDLFLRAAAPLARGRFSDRERSETRSARASPISPTSGSRPRRSGSSSASTRTPGQGGREGLKPASAWFNTSSSRCSRSSR